MPINLGSVGNTKVWVCSDLHLGHHGLLKTYDNGKGREPGYEEVFFRNYERVVGKDDIVVFCGDMFFTQRGAWADRLKTMQGSKLLVCGNHDTEKQDWYFKKGFFEVVPFGYSTTLRTKYGKILFTHVPASEAVLVSYDATRFAGLARKHNRELHDSSSLLNIHGHTHGIATEMHNTVDVSLEAINYTPVLLDQVIEARLKKDREDTSPLRFNYV